MTAEVESELLYELKRDIDLEVDMLNESNDQVLDTIIGFDEDTGEYEPDPEPLF